MNITFALVVRQNITRLIASMDMYIYNIYQDSLVVDQYISSELDLSDKEKELKIIQTSEFPHKGYSEIKILNSNNKESIIYFRIPSWDQKTKILINGEEINYKTFNGYAKIYRKWKAGDKIELKFNFTPRFVRTNPNVRYNIRKASIFRGPILYCLEEIDNGKNLNRFVIDSNNNFKEKEDKINSENIISLSINGSKFLDDLFNGEDVSKKNYRNISELTNAYKTCMKFLENDLDGNPATIKKFFNYMKDKCFVTWVKTNNFDEAFTIFERMNDRGLPLTTGDKLKHYILSTEEFPSILKSISQPKDFPIQFFCITLTLFGHLSKSSKPVKSSSEN